MLKAMCDGFAFRRRAVAEAPHESGVLDKPIPRIVGDALKTHISADDDSAITPRRNPRNRFRRKRRWAGGSARVRICRYATPARRRILRTRANGNYLRCTPLYPVIRRPIGTRQVFRPQSGLHGQCVRAVRGILVVQVAPVLVGAQGEYERADWLGAPILRIRGKLSGRGRRNDVDTYRMSIDGTAAYILGFDGYLLRNSADRYILRRRCKREADDMRICVHCCTKENCTKNEERKNEKRNEDRPFMCFPCRRRGPKLAREAREKLHLPAPKHGQRHSSDDFELHYPAHSAPQQ